MRADTESPVMTVTELASLLGTTERWVRKHLASAPFARKLSRKKLLFDRAGVMRWWSVAGPEPLRKFGP